MPTSALFLFKRLVNFFLVLCLITPLTVSYWRGTWYILDLFVFPHDKFLSAWVTLAMSFGIMYLILLVEDDLKAILNERKAKKALYLAMFYPLSFLIVTSWRGLWMLLDYYTTASLTSGCVSHAVGFFIVLSTKATSSIIALPGYCVSERNVDLSVSILERKKCFKVEMLHIWTSDILHMATRMLNSFMTVFVIGSGVICYWRGTWTIVASIKPDNNLAVSSVIAVSMGFAICSICYCLSEVVATKTLNPPYHMRLRVVEGMFVYFLGFGVVSTWVGLWSLGDHYLFPGKSFVAVLTSLLKVKISPGVVFWSVMLKCRLCKLCKLSVFFLNCTLIFRLNCRIPGPVIYIH